MTYYEMIELLQLSLKWLQEYRSEITKSGWGTAYHPVDGVIHELSETVNHAPEVRR